MEQGLYRQTTSYGKVKRATAVEIKKVLACFRGDCPESAVQRDCPPQSANRTICRAKERESRRIL